MEKWAQIGDMQYAVSTDGRVMNTNTGRILRMRINSHGYYSAHLYKDGKDYQVPLHRLVANAFIPNPDNKPQVNHIDGNKLNNDLSNLEWVTDKENTVHAFSHGLVSTSSPIRCIETGEEFYSIGEAERRTGIPDACISDCLRGICKHAHGYHFEYL